MSPTTQSDGERPVGELFKQLTDQTTTLVRHEIELAKVELADKGRAAGQGAGMFGGAGLLGLYAVGALTAAAILGLATVVDAWLAALIVAAAFGAIAGVLALGGRAKVKQASPPTPQQAVASVKEDVQWTKQQAARARQ